MEKGQAVMVRHKGDIDFEEVASRTFKGVVVQVCPSYVVIHNGKYNETFQRSDITKGVIKIEVLKG